MAVTIIGQSKVLDTFLIRMESEQREACTRCQFLNDKFLSLGLFVNAMCTGFGEGKYPNLAILQYTKGSLYDNNYTRVISEAAQCGVQPEQLIVTK